METTRHFTTKVYIVNEGATALHEHPELEIFLPPGGHIDRDELPHEAGLREVREETGFDPELYRDVSDVEVPGGRPLPQPVHHLLYDVNTYPDGDVGHQHIDFVYYASVDSRDVDPAPSEAAPETWDWYTSDELRASDFDPDTVQMGIEAIETIETAEY
ncbi:NUDIX hydrolase [halophilic archaeon]|nr:NUDIX hydrolase [halophilic archaeon]